MAQKAINKLLKTKKSNAFFIILVNYCLITITLVTAVSLLLPALSLTTNFRLKVSGSFSGGFPVPGIGMAGIPAIRAV
jgi:hypothetical protein